MKPLRGLMGHAEIYCFQFCLSSITSLYWILSYRSSCIIPKKLLGKFYLWNLMRIYNIPTLQKETPGWFWDIYGEWSRAHRHNIVAWFCPTLKKTSIQKLKNTLILRFHKNPSQKWNVCRGFAKAPMNKLSMGFTFMNLIGYIAFTGFIKITRNPVGF